MTLPTSTSPDPVAGPPEGASPPEERSITLTLNRKRLLLIVLGAVALVAIGVFAAVSLGGEAEQPDSFVEGDDLLVTEEAAVPAGPSPSEEAFLSAVMDAPGVSLAYTFLDEWTDDEIINEGWGVCLNVSDGWNRIKTYSFYQSNGFYDMNHVAAVALADQAIVNLCPENHAQYMAQ